MNWRTIKRLLKHVTKYKLLLIFALLCSTLSVVLSLFGPRLIGQGIDLMVGQGKVDFAGVLRILVILIGVYLLSALFSWILSFLTALISNRTVYDLRNSAFEKINCLPLRYFDTNPHGDTISRFVNDMDAISEGLLQGITQLLGGIITIIGSILFMLAINPVMTLVVLLSAPVAFYVAKYITLSSHKMFQKQSQNLGELNGYIEEMISGQKVVKAFSYEEQANDKFQEINSRLYESGLKAQFYSALTNPSTRYVNNITYTAVGVIGVIAAIGARLTVGNISSFLIYSTQFAKPFNEITGVLTQIQAALASAQRVFDVLDELEQTPDQPDAIMLHDCRGDISFEHVRFSYVKEKPLIRDFTLEIAAGQKVAIVGHTGAGKTTIVNLLMRFYEVNGGTIKIDGIPINTINRDSLRGLFGMVLQDTWLFSGTIRDNIAYGKADATMDEIVAAAKAANAHSFIKRLQDGYDTVISDSGGNLSEGQKQLLTIARVMLKNPPMLILDEATSSIDTMTEKKIQAAFMKMVEGRTSFVIAHRLSTVRDADMILMMEHGDIIEKGTHEELLQKKGAYEKLYKSQFAPVEQ